MTPAGKVAIVVGGGSRIGHQTAWLFAENGAGVSVAQRDPHANLMIRNSRARFHATGYGQAGSIASTKPVVGPDNEIRNVMLIKDHNDGALEKWRDGVMTQMRVSAVTGAHQICIFEQWCEPGLGAPTHHHAVEEVLEVLAGQAEIHVGSETIIAKPNQSVLIPAGSRHGFRNIGDDILHVRATIASPIFEGRYDDDSEQTRRWVPDF